MDVNATIQSVTERMARQLRVRGEGLADVSARAGRKLPRHLRREIDVLIQAEAMSQNPKLARLINTGQVRKSGRKVLKYLDKLDPKAERLGETLDVIAKIAFVIFVVVLIVFFTLLKRGYFD